MFFFFIIFLASDQDKADLCVDEIQVRQDGVSLGKKAAVERPIFFWGERHCHQIRNKIFLVSELKIWR